MIDEWLEKACYILERLNLSIDVCDAFEELDLEPQVGSERDRDEDEIENERGEEQNTREEVSVVDEGERISDNRVPGLITGTSSEEEQDEESEVVFNFKGSMEGGRVIDRSKEKSFKVGRKLKFSEEEDVTGMTLKEVIKLKELEFFSLSPSVFQRKREKDGLCWSSDTDNELDIHQKVLEHIDSY